MNIGNMSEKGLIQNNAVFKAHHLSQGKMIGFEGQTNQSIALGDEVINKMQLSLPVQMELSEEGKSKSLHLSEQIEMKPLSRSYTIAIETLKAEARHIEESLEKANSMDLSYGERLAFLKHETIKWIEQMRENDPEMFAYWLKSNAENAMSTRVDLLI